MKGSDLVVLEPHKTAQDYGILASYSASPLLSELNRLFNLSKPQSPAVHRNCTYLSVVLRIRDNINNTNINIAAYISI